MTEKVKVTVWTTPGNFVARQCVNLMKFANDTMPSKIEFDIEEKVIGTKNTVADFQAVFPDTVNVPRFVVNETKMTHKEFYTYMGNLKQND
jgi:hypothetical protein